MINKEKGRKDITNPGFPLTHELKKVYRLKINIKKLIVKLPNREFMIYLLKHLRSPE